MSLYALRGRLSSFSLFLDLGPDQGFFLDRFKRGGAIMGIQRPPDFDITNRASTKKYPDSPVNRYARYVIRSRVVITDLRNRADKIAP